MSARWNGDAWRWHMWTDAATGPRYIDVFELSAEQREERAKRIRRGARVVPFGFARVLAENREPPCSGPLRWEGDDS